MSRTREIRSKDLNYGSDTPESRERLAELMLFVSERCQNDPKFGFTKLNKIIFYADFLCFARNERSITGISYDRLPYGPVATAAAIVRSRMERDGEIFVMKDGYSPYKPHKVVPLREANLDLFTGRDIAIIDGVIQALSDTGGAKASELSHGKAWKSVAPGEKIPYEAAFVSDLVLTSEDIAAAHEMIDEFESHETERDR